MAPNPSAGTTTLTGATPGQAVQVLDALGRVAATASASGTAALYLVRAGSSSARLAVE